MARHREYMRAFTLIELLVVVAIIALLISILLPAISRAREQGRIAVCLSNMRSISGASAGYYIDNGDLVFTWPVGFKDNGGGGVSMDSGALWTEFIWGGDVPDAESGDWDPGQGRGPVTYANDLGWLADVLMYTPDRRPMNYYLDADLSWADPQRCWRAGGDNPIRTQRKSQAPAVFRCPSDKTCAMPLTNLSEDSYDPDTPYMTWKNWGTSYAINWYWGYFYTAANHQSKRKILEHIAGDSSGNPGRGRRLLRSKEMSGASEFILFYENQFNFAMENAWVRASDGAPATEQTRQYIGWHRQQDYHSAAFFDGHAEYRRFDTRFIDGPGWTTWPNRDEWEKYDVFKAVVGY